MYSIRAGAKLVRTGSSGPGAGGSTVLKPAGQPPGSCRSELGSSPQGDTPTHPWELTVPYVVDDGKFNPHMMLNADVWTRFWAKVGPPLPGGCLPWLARLDNGYGRFTVAGKGWTAHRFLYVATYGELPHRLHVDHLCRLRSCVNIKHLEAVSIRENVLRGTGLTAEATRRTVCPVGHQYDYIDPRGKRGCRECRRQSVRKWRNSLQPGEDAR